MAKRKEEQGFSGDRRRYALEPRPLGIGGYAEVFRATDAASGRLVAFKRLRRDASRDGRPRMKREIKVQTELAGHPHVMPLIDAANDGSWFVMPLAVGDLGALRESIDGERAFVQLFDEIAQGLAAAHSAGYVHRDVTPGNVLALDEAHERRWVVADWGLVRVKRGTTTTRWTRTGQVLGTEGFIAPELLRDAHREASPAADVFSLGRLLGWAVTGAWPLAGGRELPHGVFRRLVSETTSESPDRRPSLDDFRARLREAAYVPSQDVMSQAGELRNGVSKSDAAAAAELLKLAVIHRDRAELFFDELPVLATPSCEVLVRDHEQDVLDAIAAMESHLTADDDRWGDRPFDDANGPLGWLLRIAQVAAAQGNLAVLEDAAGALFKSEVVWRRFSQRRRTRSWFESIDGRAASTVARALRTTTGAIDWYREEGWVPSRATNHTLSDALRA